ncbi:MAG: Na(+)/H(+) antiporter subunit B [Wolbachia endosymbiont of Meromenopon meropis]|nr:Na(+)/H(+) antiporter subunit B [Wolbachia endosymbiont of Meromenopon meropis]
MIKDPILRTIVAFLIVPFIILFGFYIQFHGDNIPGGGFQAGIIISSGIILYSMISDISVAVKIVPHCIINFINMLGILIYVGTGIITVLFGKSFLSYGALLSNSFSGQKIGILLVEVGVALTVFSSMLIIYISLARIKR